MNKIKKVQTYLIISQEGLSLNHFILLKNISQKLKKDDAVSLIIKTSGDKIKIKEEIKPFFHDMNLTIIFIDEYINSLSGEQLMEILSQFDLTQVIKAVQRDQEEFFKFTSVAVYISEVVQICILTYLHALYYLDAERFLVDIGNGPIRDLFWGTHFNFSLPCFFNKNSPSESASESVGVDEHIGNHIYLSDSPHEMFQKMMEVSDAELPAYATSFDLSNTDVPLSLYLYDMYQYKLKLSFLIVKRVFTLEKAYRAENIYLSKTVFKIMQSRKITSTL